MKKAGDVLRGFLTDEQAAAAGRWSTFFSGWQKIAGTDIAAHSRVRDVKSGVVIVEVDHPGWLQMLQMKKEQILADMKKTYPELGIDNIRIFVGDSESIGRDKPGSKAVDDTTLKGRGPQKRRHDESSPEYQRFKAMLERLRKTPRKR